MAAMAISQERDQRLWLTGALRIKLPTQKEEEHGAWKGEILNKNGTSREYLGT